MASATKQTEMIRKRKLGKQGTRRKAKDRTQGTTKSAQELFGDEASSN